MFHHHWREGKMVPGVKGEWDWWSQLSSSTSSLITNFFGCSLSCKCHVWANLLAMVFFSCKFACHSSPSWTFDVTSGWCNTYDNFIPLLSHALPLLPLWTQSNRRTKEGNQKVLAQVVVSLSTAAVQQSHMLALIDQSVDTCMYTRS